MAWTLKPDIAPDSRSGMKIHTMIDMFDETYLFYVP